MGDLHWAVQWHAQYVSNIMLGPPKFYAAAGQHAQLHAQVLNWTRSSSSLTCTTTNTEPHLSRQSSVHNEASAAKAALACNYYLLPCHQVFC